MRKELEKYVRIFENKSYVQIRGEFVKVFNEIYSNITEYGIEEFITVDQILSHYKNFRIFVDKKDRKKKQYIEEDRLYEQIISSPFYIEFLNCKFLANYPKCEESLYKLELDFQKFLKEMEVTLVRKDKVINIDRYNEILAILDYLSDFINERTIYIAHNIILYYKDVIKTNEYAVYRDKDNLIGNYQSITESNSNYQKYKR